MAQIEDLIAAYTLGSVAGLDTGTGKRDVDLKDPVSAYPLRTDQIIRKWKQIDRVGEDNYYRKHHFTKVN
jgi:hypothetical protein